MRVSSTLRPWLTVALLLTLASALGLSRGAADDPKPAPAAVKPRTVTIRMEAPLDKVLDELQKQTDVAIDRSRAETARPVKVDLDKVPFWVAVEQIAKAADQRLMFGEQGRSLMFVGGEGATYRELPLSIDGLFRTAAHRVTAVRDLEGDRSFCDVQLSLNWEPHFSAFLVESPGKTVTARDNTDKELPVGESRGRIAVSGGGTLLTVRLTDVPRSARTIKLLEGKLGVIGAQKMLRFEFPKTGKDEAALTQEGVTVKVRTDFAEGSDLWTARVVLEYPEGGPQLESFESAAWLAENSAFLVSKDNKRRLDVNGGVEYETQGERRAVVVYRWVPSTDNGTLGKPSDWTLAVRTPSRLTEVPVSFKLENIPLP